MTGQRIQAIDQIDVKGNARFRELPTVGSQTQPLAVDANAFRLNNPDAMNAFVQAVGEPTVISTGGFEIKATNVQLDKEKNLVWSNGSGTATIPIQQDFQGKPLDAPTQATVTWSRSMEFDGVLIKLHGDAIVKGPDFRLQSEHLQARLNRRIDFSAKQSGKPDVEQITAQDKVVAIYETREYGRLMSSSFMRVPNITLNTTNGDVAVDGAGQIMMTKRGFNASNQLVPSGKAKSAQVATNQEPTDNRLTFLQIDFQSDIRGNLEQRILEFNRKVRAIYGPVYEWNQKINPNADPQEDDILLSCDKLVVAQGRPDSNDFRPFDMRATGNVFVEGQAFQATGERVTYDQSKDMLILRGNGQTDARIQYRRDERGATIDKSAKEFKFYPGKREAEFNEFRSLEFRTIGR
jgi:lipopolysaccharide export system protein LptA